MSNSFVKCVSLLTLCYVPFCLAADPDYDYFLDHENVLPGKSLSVNYSFPSPQHTIECHQDSPASNLGSVEWIYQGTVFKGQIGSMRSLVLGTDQPNFKQWRTQTADASGQLTFINLDKWPLQVTCSYQLEEAISKK